MLHYTIHFTMLYTKFNSKLYVFRHILYICTLHRQKIKDEFIKNIIKVHLFIRI